ncbi:Listeria/Bacterioides repeat-containing protein [Trichlorobacter thiogenes]|uniref:Listeria/Bacterioides repeat-containing protein n=1 Tax=Trichlorobacter thiogenes TaxID=115783 RepID=A0A1T4N6F6_9BACT|nr:LamG-like jellyroll fold domain-containing protein [Trichlorobacter thiogenes]SJZ74782.1 Listeria/Bacterioides repeat-containing protein [Trichlorobacter thiogenes]
MRQLKLMVLLLFSMLLLCSSQVWSLDRFVDLNDGTMLDTVSSLRWLKNANCYGIQNWDAAKSSAAGLASPSCGLSDSSTTGDWHLPTIDELSVFVNAGYRDDTLNAAGFNNVQADNYWSSTDWFYYTLDALFVGMGDGNTGAASKVFFNYVWPVRAGQHWSLGALVILGAPDFGNQILGSVSSGHQFTLQNSSANPLTVTSIALNGTDSGQFTLATGGTNPCSSLTSPTLATGASCTVLVSAKPTTIGSKSANLTVTSGGLNVNVPLTATVSPLSVTYNGNGSSSGSEPVDSTGYTLNATATVLNNSGGLAKTGYVFNGWNTAADASGTTYQPGATFNIAAPTTLYARWTAPITPPSSLVSWWRAEGDALDTRGGLVGTATSGITYTAGKVGQAFSFSGVFNGASPSYITVPDNPLLNFGTHEFSIATWIKTTNTGSYKRIVTKRITDGATAWYSLAAHNGKVLFETGVNNITSSATVTDGQWHHVAVTRDPASSSPRKFHLYIDGVEDASVPDSGANLDNACPLELGKWFNENYYDGIYSGQIDELQFFNRALAAVDVQNIYNAGSAGLALVPTVTGISPARGLATGGSQVLITGTNLANASTVKFGATTVAGFTIVSDTQITAIAPAGTVTSIVDICVTTPGGTSVASSSSKFTYTGLVSWWKGEGNALDAVGGLNGTVGLYPYYTPGKIGQAFFFTGNPTGYVTVPDNQKLRFGVDEFSLAVWVKTSDVGTWTRVITKRPASGATAWYSLGVSGNKAIFEITAGTPLTSALPVADDAWHHIAVTRDPVGSLHRKFRLYVDGVEDVTMDDTGVNLDNNGPLEIAKWAIETPGGAILRGSIDEVQLFNRALTATEVLENYHAVPGVAWPLSVTKTGSGTVTTNVSPGTLSWSDNTGTASYPDSTSLTLTAIPENGSGFSGWGGDCSGTDTSRSLSMFVGHTASASFFVNDYVRLGALTTPYGTLHHAYAAAQPGNLIKALGLTFTEDLTIDRGLSVTLQGGYVAGFGSRSGSTTLNGRLTISSGSLVVDQLIVAGAISE